MPTWRHIFGRWIKVGSAASEARLLPPAHFDLAIEAPLSMPRRLRERYDARTRRHVRPAAWQARKPPIDRSRAEPERR